jgi:signal transduction histidine kinase/ActR/RegA family two-component response regulator
MQPETPMESNYLKSEVTKKAYLSQKPLKLWPRIGVIVTLALVYYGTAEIARHIAATPQDVTPVWPPDGFATAATLIFGYQVLPGVLLGSFLANIWAFFDGENLYTAIASILQVLGITVGTTAGTGIGYYLFRRFIGSSNPFRRLNSVYIFLIFTSTLAPMINATSGVASLCLGAQIPWSEFSEVWFIWWISNVSGICIFTPALLSFYQLYRSRNPHRFTFKSFSTNISTLRNKLTSHKSEVIEVSSLIGIVLYISYISFYQQQHLEYVLIPCLVWSALRLGQLLTTNLIVIITTIAVLGTVRGFGSFASQNLNDSLIQLQSFIIVIVVTTLSLLAILSEKQQAFKRLKQSEQILTERTNQLENSQSNLHETALILEQQNIALTQAKKNADKANSAKTEFLSNMSHELRTPLNAVLGLVQLLKSSKNLDNLELADLQTVHDSGTHLLYLIEDILDISKIEAGKMELHYQEVYLQTFLERIAAIIRVQANHKKLDFICEFSPNLPQLIWTDNKRLKQVLLNLLNNATKFTQKGHVIFRVSAEHEKVKPEGSKSFTEISFEIEDSGMGIHPEKLKSIFLPFEQTGESRFKVQGTGLGLAISQKIINMMDSQIIVDSQIGMGSCFSFVVKMEVLPTKVSSSKPLTLLSNLADENWRLAHSLPLKILLAEDNIVNQKVVSKILQRLGYEIDIANNGLEVIEATRDNNYDVIFMDVQMPEMDGIEATKYILESAYRPYIIALTANAMSSDRILCLAAGMNDYLTKPLNIDLLVEALWRSPRGRQILQETEGE